MRRNTIRMEFKELKERMERSIIQDNFRTLHVVKDKDTSSLPSFAKEISFTEEERSYDLPLFF